MTLLALIRNVFLYIALTYGVGVISLVKLLPPQSRYNTVIHTYLPMLYVISSRLELVLGTRI